MIGDRGRLIDMVLLVDSDEGTSLFIAERRGCVLGPSWHHVVGAPRGPTS